MKTFTVAMIIFLTANCNLGNSGGVSVCESIPSMNGKDIFSGKESGLMTKAKAPVEKNEPLLLLRILTEL